MRGAAGPTFVVPKISRKNADGSRDRWEIHHDMLTTCYDLSTKTVARAWSANEDTTFGSSATERTFTKWHASTKHMLVTNLPLQATSLTFPLPFPSSPTAPLTLSLPLHNGPLPSLCR